MSCFPGCERADLLDLVYDVLLCFVTFPCGILGQVWYLIVSIPDLCRLSYFTTEAQDRRLSLMARRRRFDSAILLSRDFEQT